MGQDLFHDVAVVCRGVDKLSGGDDRQRVRGVLVAQRHPHWSRGGQTYTHTERERERERERGEIQSLVIIEFMMWKILLVYQNNMLYIKFRILT